MNVEFHNVKFHVSFFLIANFIVALVACQHKPAEMPIPPSAVLSACDTTGITYAKDIRPIFNDHCYSCHGTIVTANGGLDLEDSSSLRSYLKYDFRGDGIYGSKLYHCILHSQYALPMPPRYIIDSCSISKIKVWLSGGALM